MIVLQLAIDDETLEVLYKALMVTKTLLSQCCISRLCDFSISGVVIYEAEVT